MSPVTTHQKLIILLATVISLATVALAQEPTKKTTQTQKIV